VSVGVLVGYLYSHFLQCLAMCVHYVVRGTSLYDFERGKKNLSGGGTIVFAFIPRSEFEFLRSYFTGVKKRIVFAQLRP
jgi:hypothetical protein